MSWHRPEYEALGVPFEKRGELLDEHLAAWDVLWRETPASFEGRHYRFRDVYLEPKPWRPDGPKLWFGGASLHDRLLRRLVRYGHGFNPLGSPTDADLARLRAALADAGRDLGELELVGGTRGRFPGPDSVADLDEALAAIPGTARPGLHVDLHQAVAVHRRSERARPLVPEGRGAGRGVRVTAWAGRGPAPTNPRRAGIPGSGGPVGDRPLPDRRAPVGDRPLRPWSERAG